MQINNMKMYLDSLLAIQSHLDCGENTRTSDATVFAVGVDLPIKPPAEWKEIIQIQKTKTAAKNKSYNTPINEAPSQPKLSSINVVCILDPSGCNRDNHQQYIMGLLREYLISNVPDSLMLDICAHFTLNTEQIRAFVTVASHCS